MGPMEIVLPPGVGLRRRFPAPGRPPGGGRLPSTPPTPPAGARWGRWKSSPSWRRPTPTLSHPRPAAKETPTAPSLAS